MKPVTYIFKPEMEGQNPYGWDKMVLINITDSSAPKKKKSGQGTDWFQRYFFVCDDEFTFECGWEDFVELEECYTIDPKWNSEPDVNQQISDLTQQVSNLTKIMIELIQIQKRVF